MYRVREISKELFDLIDDNLTGVKTKNNELNNAASALYFTAYDSSKALNCLIGESLQGPAIIIKRNILEAYIDLYNLNKDEEYLNIIKHEALKIEIKVVNNKNNTNNKYLNGIYNFEEKTIEAANKLLMDYKKKIKNKYGKKVGLIKEKFDIAGKVDLYDSYYTVLSSYTHNNNIYNRIDNNKNNTIIHMTENIKDKTKIEYYNFLNGILIDSTIYFLNIIDYKSNIFIEGLIDLKNESQEIVNML